MSHADVNRFLETLRGLPLSGRYRVLATQTFLLGAHQDNNDHPYLAQGVLDIESPWRLMEQDRILVSSSDVVLDESDASIDDQFLESELRDFLLSRVLGEVDSRGIKLSDAKKITVENIAITPLGDLTVEFSSGLTLHSFNSNRGSAAWLLSTDDATYSCSSYDNGVVRFSRVGQPSQPDDVAARESGPTTPSSMS